MKKLYSENSLYYLVYSVFIIIAFQLHTSFPELNLDPSWIKALSYATKQHLVWGKDIIFTYGPWHMVSTRAYDPQFYCTLLLSQIYVWLAFGWFFFSNYKNILLYFFLITCAFLNLPIDTIFFAIAFVFFLKSLSEDIRNRIILCLFLLLSGFITLSKMSYLPMYLGLMLLADIYQIIKYRKFPLYTICISASFVSFWMLSGHEVSDLPIFLNNIKPIISAYSESMQANKGVAVFYIVSSINFVLILNLLYGAIKKGNFGEYRSSISSKLSFLIILIAVIFYQYLTIKAASMRLDDGHSSIAFASSLFIIVFLLLYPKQPIVSSAKDLSTIQKCIIVTNIILLLFLSQPERLLLTPGNLNKKYNNTQQELAKIAKTKLGDLKLEDIKGSVDSYPWDIAELLALNLNYSPRPILQTYSSFSLELQNKDLAHLQGNNAPQSLFFRIEDIDERFPTTTLGPSLLEILKDYRFKAKTGLGLFLERRKIPLNAKLVSENEVHIKNVFSDHVMLPKADENTIRIISIDMNLTILGHILKILSKTPQIGMDVVTNDSTYSSRLIAPAAKAGFMISPVIKNQDETYTLFENIEDNKPLNTNQVREIKLHIKRFRWAYKKDAVIKWRDFKLENNK